jgi:hypothetical protein
MIATGKGILTQKKRGSCGLLERLYSAPAALHKQYAILKLLYENVLCARGCL